MLTTAVMGGLFANAANTLPGLFGEGAIFGFQWIRDYPYALPSLVNAFTLALCTIWTWLFLREVQCHSRQTCVDVLTTCRRHWKHAWMTLTSA